MAPNTQAPQVYQPATDRDPKLVRLEGIVRGHRIARELELESIGRAIAALKAEIGDEPDSTATLRKK